jgi:hypothetical protein
MADAQDDRVLPQLQMTARLRGYRCTVVSPDEVEVETTQGRQVLSLSNLRMLVAQEPPAKRLAFVIRFLDQLVETGSDDAAAPDFEVIKKDLRVRLYPADMREPGYEPLSRVVVPGLAENVVIDEPARVVTPGRDTTDGWPVTAEEIFARGRENVRTGTRLSLHSLEADDGAIFAGYLNEYASAHALWLDEYPVLGRHGALVCVPVEGALFVHPLDGPNLIEAQNALVRIGLGRQEESARRISANVYHWDNSLAGGASPLRLALTVKLGADQTIELLVDPGYQGLMESLL